MANEQYAAYGRRLADRLSRYAEVLLLALISALLSVIIYFYADIPKRIDLLVTAVEKLELRVANMEERVREVKEAQRVSENWRDRLNELEKQVDRNTSVNVQQDKRLDKLEEPPSLFGTKKK